MWKKVTLADVCTLRNGRAYKKPELLSEGKYPVLRVGNFFTSDNWYYSDLELDETKYCDTGDLLYAWSASFGARMWEGEKVIYHYHIWRVDVETEIIDKKFLFYWFEFDKEKIKKESGTGTTMMHVSKGSMEKRELWLPPLAEQKRIVAKLDAAFAEIDSILKSSHLKRTEVIGLPTQILKKLLEDEAYEWTSERLSSISDNLDSQRIPITKSKRIEGNIPYYGASGIVDYVKDFIFDDELLLISEDGANLLARTYPIAFSVEGKTWVNNHAHVLKFENKMLQKWVEYYLNSTNIEAFISGMAQPKLNQKKLNEIPIPCPKPNLLPKLLSNLEKIISQSESVFELEKQKTKKIEKLKSAILAQELQSEAA